MNRTTSLSLFLVGLSGICQAQEPALIDMPSSTLRQMYAARELTLGGLAALTPVPLNPSEYLLGPGDQMSVIVGELDEFTDKTFRIDMRGDINLPLAGRIHASGLTVQAFETQIKSNLRKILKDPDVVVTVTAFASQPVSVLGAVNLPGVHQLQGQKTLFEVLSLSGGLRPDAGTSVKITRDLKWGAIPLPGAAADPSGQYSIASVKVKRIMNATEPADNVLIRPGDTIAVPRADLVYVVGSVVKPGGFPLGENETLSALQVVSLAEGLQKTAAADKAKILRAVPGSSTRTEITINIKQLMAGRTQDIPLRSDDILFVPNSGAKSAAYRSIDSIVSIATGMVVYGKL
jgi:polysaccharide export outer membrane protein